MFCGEFKPSFKKNEYKFADECIVTECYYEKIFASKYKKTIGLEIDQSKHFRLNLCEICFKFWL